MCWGKGLGYILKRVDLKRPHQGSDILASHLKLLGEGVACVQGQRAPGRGTASANTQREECAWRVQGIIRR